MKFLIEIEQRPVITVTVDAGTDQEALDKVLRQEGETGDIFYREPTFTIKRLED